MSEKLRLPAEQSYAAELKALAASDGHRPPSWALAPRQVVTYLMGGKASDGTAITPKYVGDKRLIETAVATLATDRALLLLGVPGTAKSWVSEHLAAGDHRRFHAGDPVHGRHRREPDPLRLELCPAARAWAERARRWSQTPLMRAMEDGKLCRFEELTRMGTRRAGHADHRAVREDDADPGAQYRRLRAARLQHHRHRQQPRQGRQRTVLARSSAASTSSCCRCPTAPRRKSRSSSSASARWRRASICRRRRTSRDEVRARRLDLPRAALRLDARTARSTLKSPSGGLSTAEAIAVMIGGISQAAFFNEAS